MIIGVNGFKGVGKDVVASYLVERYGFQKASFAALLKDSVAALFEISVDQIEQWKNSPSMTVKIVGPSFPAARDIKTHSQLTFRQFLQRYGTEAHRDIFGYNFWVDALVVKLDQDVDYVIPDARFENELRAVKSLGGFNWSVERPGYEGEDHASEVPPNPDLINQYLFNTDTFALLYNQIDVALNKARKLSGDPRSFGHQLSLV